MTENSKPIEKIMQFPVSAAIWRNMSREGAVFYSVSFERSYRDDNGAWKTTGSFRDSDLLLLAKAADLAHSRVGELKAKDHEAPESQVA